MTKALIEIELPCDTVGELMKYLIGKEMTVVEIMDGDSCRINSKSQVEAIKSKGFWQSHKDEHLCGCRIRTENGRTIYTVVTR